MDQRRDRFTLLRNPAAPANWKMGMTVGEGLEFTEYLEEHVAGKLLGQSGRDPLSSLYRPLSLGLGFERLDDRARGPGSLPHAKRFQTRKE